ncbi:hypothetical protein [Clostridium sp. MD294]|uniref:hypothetical protein n=1 Tax=Clostridium sp. MD294 TaxID=97138 RepID=UPI0002CCB8A0|nr:hypothetical protein [Clostridium sp. MD294]NDO46177.1 hypothetical protein [Clostridium sp. MD294]USF30157.1 hypothetical protein C820_001598 [Clostridium sp. MD294]
MKKTVEEKAELAKLKIDKKLQKQQQKAEKMEAKKEAATAKKEAKKELQEQRKAAKKEIASAKKETQKELAEQKKAAKKEAAERKKNAKQEAASKIKTLKENAKQGKTSSGEKAASTKAKKKEKPAKKVKPSPKAKDKGKEKGEQSAGGNKKKLFAGALALVFVCAGVVGFLHFRGGNKEEEKDPYIEAYVLDDDFVTSIPKFLGESEKRALPEITEEENNGSKRIVYNYTELKNADEEVKDYINFLTGEQEFVPMFDYNLDAPGGYVSVGTASQEEGKTLKIDIDYTDTDYKVMVSKTSEKLPKPKDDSDKIDISRDGALTYLSSFSAEKLGLPKPIEEYKAIYDNGQSSINNHNCYGISLYELGKAGTNEFQGKYFVATNQSAIYRYDVEQNKYIEIENSELPAKATETLQQTAAQLNEVSENSSDSEQEQNDKTEKENDNEEEKENSTDEKDQKEKEDSKDKKDEKEKEDSKDKKDEKEKEDSKDKKDQKEKEDSKDQKEE